MGLLVLGTPLAWEDSVKYLKYVREHGILQFLSIFNAVKDVKNSRLFWGEEVEYIVQRVDQKNKNVRLSLRGKEIRDELNENEDKFLSAGGKPLDSSIWHPEYGSFMVECTPKIPYSGFTTDLLRVEDSLRNRRQRLYSVLQADEIAPSITAFPMMGVGDFCSPSAAATPEDGFSESKWVSDEVINPHPRFGTLTQNIRKRRGQNVDIRIPLFQDSKTFTNSKRRKAMVSTIGHANPAGVKGISSEESAAEDQAATAQESIFSNAAGTDTDAGEGRAGGGPSSLKMPGYDVWLSADDEIVMDCMAFGMGCCCLQVTFQARDVEESRALYDSLIPLAPIMLALTAAAPIFKGQLADTDCRWNVIGMSTDDRTMQEQGKHVVPGSNLGEERLSSEMAGDGKRRLEKSRYASVSRYMANNPKSDPQRDAEQYNDVDAPIDEAAYETLVENGVDDLLAKHIAHLFVRDPLVIFEERVKLDDSTENDHFENIQSTNWQSLRWKPPPKSCLTGKQADGSDGATGIGWRVEFRTMELQLTDFENAAFSIFIVLASRMILAFDLNTYIPMSKVDQNMELAHRRDAVRNERFWFRRHMVAPEGGVGEYEDVCEQMSVQQILMGKGTYFPGLIPMIFAYLDATGCDPDVRHRLSEYLRFIAARATGQLVTAAKWMRMFVTTHEDYQQDSVVTHKIATDLMQACHRIGMGLLHVPQLHGDFKIRALSTADAYPRHLSAETIGQQERDRLIKKYAGRCSFVDSPSMAEKRKK